MLLNGTKKIMKELLIATAIVVSIILVIIILRVVIGYVGTKNAQISDTNGDSKELCYITDEYIEKTENSYDIIKHNRKKDSSFPSGVKGVFEDKDLTYSAETMESLSGVYLCNAYLSSGAPVKYMISSTVNCGNLRIVITDETNKILYDVPIDVTHNVELPTEEWKIYYVKLVGESANITVSVTRGK